MLQGDQTLPSDMTISGTDRMDVLYRKLSTIGVTRPFVREKLLPDWWQDRLAENPAGFAQAAGMISRYLGVEVGALLRDDQPLRCRELGPTKFKKQQGVNESALQLAKCIGGRALELACQAAPAPKTRIPRSAAELRRHLLHSAPYISLGVLLDFCWDAGIPVLHISSFPHGNRKMDAMAAVIDGCPGIVLCFNRKPSAWLLFHLAHEVGHIALGHLSTTPFLVDEKVERGKDDPEEAEANLYATELLTGVTELYAPHIMHHERLAAYAGSVGQAYRIDPGTVALSYGWTHKQHWGTVGAALSLLEPNGDGPALVRSRLTARLEWDELPEESGEYLQRITGPNRD